MAFKYNIIRAFEDEKADGKLLTIISQLRRKYQKGKSISEAADDLEEDVSAILPFYDLITKYPEEDDEKILSRYKEEK